MHTTLTAYTRVPYFPTSIRLVCLLACSFAVGFFSDSWLVSNRDRPTNTCDYQNYILGIGGEQSDRCLIDIVRNKFMIPPSNLPYNLSINKPTSRLDLEKLNLLEKVITNMEKPGFFIECGANDGEWFSPTLHLEKKYNWTGLLIEPNADPFIKLSRKNRKAWSVNAAACVTRFARQIDFFTNPKNTVLAGLNIRKRYGVDVHLTVQCFPLYTMLVALNVTEVDYLSLDVEGKELEILKTVPFDKIKFKFLTIEHGLVPGGRKSLQEFLETKGYFFVKEIMTADSAFIHYSYKTKFLVEGY